jgi:predicted ester cyclase
MSAEEYKALVRRGWEEVINQRNLNFLAEAHPADAIWHEPDQDIEGIEQMKHYLALTFEAFPDFNVSVEDVIAEGEKVVSRYTFRGTPRRDGGVWPSYWQTDGARRHQHAPL